MTSNGVSDLYDRLTTLWPMVYKPNASENWKRSALKNYYEAFKDFTDAEVMTALMAWALDNEKPPTIKNIVNEVQWTRVKKSTAGRENEELWPMDWIDKDGFEWSWGCFKRSDFLKHPKNLDKLQPEEWERRFRAQRRQWYKDHRPEPSPEAKIWGARITESIRRHIEERSNTQ